MLVGFFMRFWYVLIFLLVVVMGVGSFVVGGFLTGDVVRGFDEYSYTRAVCSGETKLNDKINNRINKVLSRSVRVGGDNENK